MFYYYIELAGHLVSGLSFWESPSILCSFAATCAAMRRTRGFSTFVLVWAGVLFGVHNLMRFVVILAGAKGSSFGTSLDIAAEILRYFPTDNFVVFANQQDCDCGRGYAAPGSGRGRPPRRYRSCGGGRTGQNA